MDEPYEVTIGRLLNRRGWKLAVAESCTGGLIGHLITNVAGSSDYFLGGAVAYAYQAKKKLLGVRAETLEQFGAVSRETVLEMAQGTRLAFDADISLSVSGIAGPGGGTPDKPVGLTWIGLSSPTADLAWQYVWQGNREQVKAQTAQQALRLLVDFLSKEQERSAPLQVPPEEIEVTARFTADGGVVPTGFSINGRPQRLASSGRTWRDPQGLHFLVMNLEGQVFELIYQPLNARWRLSRKGSPPSLA